MEYKIQTNKARDKFTPMVKFGGDWCTFESNRHLVDSSISFPTLEEADKFLQEKKDEEPIDISWPIVPIDPTNIHLEVSLKELTILSDACSCLAGMLSNVGDPVDEATIESTKNLLIKLDAASNTP